MFFLGALFVPTHIPHNNHEDGKTESQKNDHSRPIFPDLLDPIRKLGPIHATASYTSLPQK
jgi:hypothetical protein